MYFFFFFCLFIVIDEKMVIKGTLRLRGVIVLSILCAVDWTRTIALLLICVEKFVIVGLLF